ncbi:SAC3/GANP/Nin1/mts3/eIF-3 p25 family-domain-containing protein [Coniochaeta sp. 2T2.1]|nr:SAC3/GANP/Nin1/mts3/eIF-3 p25 family-domain-containing protein [Coniochaeta sp. 2T2.1]
MADRQLSSLRDQLKSPSLPYQDAVPLLSKSKILLLQNNSLTPSPSSPAPLLLLAREILELGALHAIRSRDAPAFIRYVDQLQPFYSLHPGHAAAVSGAAVAERNKITGLYLLLLLSQSRYSEFHSELEALATREGGGSSVDVEGDRYLGYPIRLERWLMEGSYDRVWKAMKNGEVPCEEYGVFSEILTTQIRNEIASSSERAYPSLPLSSTKSLLFLDSERAVVDFAHSRGWTVRDGQIFFPAATDAADGEPEKDVSQMVIENTLGYARQLETIV